MASSMRSRRRATAIAVPGTVAVLLAGAYAAAPALAASTSPSLPFPSVCPTGQSASSVSTPAPSSSSTSKSPTATPTASADKSAGAASSSPKPSATPTTSATTAKAPVTTSSASPSTSASSSTGGDGFWGWLNGVWTWIFSDSPTSANSSTVQDAVAPLSAPRAVDAAAALGAREAGSSASPDCVSAKEASKLAAEAAASPSEGVTAPTIPWVMKAPEMTMWNLTFNGVKSVKVWDASSKSYVDENVLDFTASSLTIQSMVTYSIQNGQTVFNNAGSGTTTTLTNPHLMVTKMTADLYGLLGQTYDPDHLPPLPVGVTVPLVPVIFTNVTSVIAQLHTDDITVPGFAGFASDGVAEPQ